MNYIDHWLARPYQIERQIDKWQKDKNNEDILDIESVNQYVGLKAYAITITNKLIPSDNKEKILFSVPHAHEPTGTVACMNVINQLLTEKKLDGSPSDIVNKQKILDKCVLSFIPDANPDGRSRAPVDYWDGTKYTNDEFWAFMRGRDPETKKMWKRMGRWSIRNENPETIGIVYEQLSDHEYVEPNRDFESAYFRLVKMIWKKYGYGRWLDLHQTEFENSKYNAMIILPIVQNELPEHIQKANIDWANEIVKQWQKAGAEPMPESRPLGYTGEQAEYFRKTWREFMPMISEITTEIQNNNIRTHPNFQAELQEIAIKASIYLVISN
ncbi:MAG: M14 family zinc carboxypeptidase [Candidatus Poribacteria bacterium]